LLLGQYIYNKELNCNNIIITTIIIIFIIIIIIIIVILLLLVTLTTANNRRLLTLTGFERMTTCTKFRMQIKNKIL